jgi:drug/metabolite transporter (DMT)-like permease
VPVILAYIILVAIWSTTPLAIQWSGQGPGFALGLALRLLIGAMVCYGILLVTRQSLSWSRVAILAYGSATIGIFGAMMFVYWGAQYIPSGTISVLFGMTPLFTAFLAYWILSETSITAAKIIGIVLGIIGLGFVFVNDLSSFRSYGIGVVAVLVSTALHSLSMVLTKKYDKSVTPLSVTTGGLLFSLPLAFITWFILDGKWPENFPLKAGISITYLGIVATGIGFNLYYFTLQRVAASRLALIPLITPITALLLGVWINHEIVTVQTIVGTGLITLGLTVHLFNLNPFNRLKRVRVN